VGLDFVVGTNVSPIMDQLITPIPGGEGHGYSPGTDETSKSS